MNFNSHSLVLKSVSKTSFLDMLKNNSNDTVPSANDVCMSTINNYSVLEVIQASLEANMPFARWRLTALCAGVQLPECFASSLYLQYQH